MAQRIMTTTTATNKEKKKNKRNATACVEGPLID